MANKFISTFKFALTLAAGLFAAQYASADTIDIKGFSGASANVNISLTNGTNYHTGATGVSFSESGGAGSFTTLNKTTNTTFQSWCVDIFHDFSFGNPGATTDTLVSASSLFGQTKANNLGSLYTIYANNLAANNSSNMNPAFQLAVWAIVNTPDNVTPLLNGSVFKASAGTAVDQKAALMLSQLSTTKSLYTANVWSVLNNSVPTAGKGYSWGAQDVVVFSQVTAVPEPESYAMMLMGLGLMGVIARRRMSKKA